MKKLITPLVAIVCLTHIVFGQNPQWIIFNTSNSGIAGNSILSLLIDENDAKWIGTIQDGLSKYDGVTWNSYGSSTPGWNGSDDVREIARDDSGILWIRNYGGYLIKFDGTTLTSFDWINSGFCPLLEALAVEGNGTVWLGSLSLMEDGCGLMHTTDGSDWGYYYTWNSWIPDDHVYYIAIDQYGNKWLRCNGLTKFTGSTWTNYTIENSGLPNNYIKHIAFEADTLWIGTSGGGLTKFDGTDWITYNTYNSDFPSNYVNSIAVDTEGNKWIGTEDHGLVEFDGSTFTVYNHSNSGLPNNNVNTIAIDENGSKWIGTWEGLAVFNENGIPVSINENRRSKDNAMLFPNPVKNELHVELTPGIHISHFEILDMCGNIVKSHNLQAKYNTINVKDLPSGIFLTRLYSDQEVILKKIIKQ